MAIIISVIFSNRNKISIQVLFSVLQDQRNDSLELKGRSFTYSDILQITNNFKTVLGKGGFGTVYHGYLGDTQVAVKLLSSSSTQGHKEFQAEVGSNPFEEYLLNLFE